VLRTDTGELLIGWWLNGVAKLLAVNHTH